MFHAHQSEFTKLGWVGHFDVPLSFVVLAAGGLLVLLVPLVLSVTKPRGLTRYGWRKQVEQGGPYVSLPRPLFRHDLAHVVLRGIAAQHGVVDHEGRGAGDVQLVGERSVGG